MKLVPTAGSKGAGTALGLLTLVGALAGIGCAGRGSLPSTPNAYIEAESEDEAAIERREVCVGSAIASAGKLADTLYYRASALPDGKLVVGYYAFFSDERPWGNNWLTWSVLPAIAVDLVYTRSIFAGPGLQRALSGKGDVEGFRIVYGRGDDGSLVVDRAVADDGTHRPVHLAASEVMRIDPERPTVYTNVWSHQLGGRGRRSRAELAYLRCFGPGHIRPLSDAVAAEYALDHRARPAHLDALGGRPLGGPAVGIARGASKTVEARATGAAPRL